MTLPTTAHALATLAESSEHENLNPAAAGLGALLALLLLLWITTRFNRDR